ncbi:hypothetical protein ACFY1S_15625 [Micromonospora sp. NPDC000663]|uniref:hypothetical protein n=1 Tax=Micromonospora sp. NPDC000663 TaxID=3364218 RepID=UPI0036AC3FCA
MRPDEFLRTLALFPPPLHDRALTLRAFTRPTHCDDCQRIGDASAWPSPPPTTTS